MPSIALSSLFVTTFVFFVCSLDQTNAVALPRKYVLIYTGAPVCEGCGESWGAVAESIGEPIKYFSNWGSLPNLLGNASALVIGGTEDDLAPFKSRLTAKSITLIQTWIANGGRYLGSCGGAYIVDKKFSDGYTTLNTLAISPVSITNYIQSANGRLFNISWLGSYRMMFFQSGPVFKPNKSLNETLQGVAYYPDGRLTAFKNTYKKGKVFVVGVHPEADKTWLQAYGIPSKTWPDTSKDIATAFLKDLLSANVL